MKKKTKSDRVNFRQCDRHAACSLYLLPLKVRVHLVYLQGLKSYYTCIFFQVYSGELQAFPTCSLRKFLIANDTNLLFFRETVQFANISGTYFLKQKKTNQAQRRRRQTVSGCRQPVCIFLQKDACLNLINMVSISRVHIN